TAMLVAHAETRRREIGITGMWGNLGVSLAALLTGFHTAHFGWRAAFILPGGVANLLGIGFFYCVREEPSPHL
ncbi:MFS transporter, partial [Pseudomonas aeruginosa]|uniref:MFS transporter n=1 Tax=Pseudomonas aeruginosa TaxID=287 RepID=UPI003F7F9A11